MCGGFPGIAGWMAGAMAGIFLTGAWQMRQEGRSGWIAPVIMGVLPTVAIISAYFSYC